MRGGFGDGYVRVGGARGGTSASKGSILRVYDRGKSREVSK